MSIIQELFHELNGDIRQEKRDLILQRLEILQDSMTKSQREKFLLLQYEDSYEEDYLLEPTEYDEWQSFDPDC